MNAAPLSFEPIGLVHTAVPDEEVPRRRRDMVSEIEVFAPYSAALEGIEDYSHLYVLFWMHKLPKGAFKPQVHPHGADPAQATGVLATRSPHRPNPIGLAVVELLGRRGARLQVRRLDAYEGSPVIDIKPYDPYDVFEGVRVPDWWRQSRRPGN